MSMKSMIAWQTGCPYTTAGQRIAASVEDDGTVHFIDIDRGIWGMLERKYHGLVYDFSPEWVHREYLLNKYEWFSPSGDLYCTLRDAALGVKPLDEMNEMSINTHVEAHT